MGIFIHQGLVGSLGKEGSKACDEGSVRVLSGISSRFGRGARRVHCTRFGRRLCALVNMIVAILPRDSNIP